MYVKGVIARLFSEFNKRPLHLQAEIIEALEDFISAWKIKHQHLRNNPCSRWKSGEHLMASDNVSTENISNTNEQPEGIRLGSGCKTREKADDKNAVHNDSEMIISNFWHEAMIEERSAMVPLLGFSGSTEKKQQPLSVLFISNNLSATDCKVETEILAGRVSASQPQDWTLSKSLDTTAELSESKVPNEALDKCNTAAADVAAEDGDGDDDEGKNGDFASFKEEPMKEDDGYSNEHVSAEILSDTKPKSRRTRQKLNSEGNWTTREKSKASKIIAQPPPPTPHQQLTVCEICGARVKIIKVHMMQHGERLHTCPYCNYTSHQRGTVDIHIRRLHTNDRPHLCEICGKGFVKSSLLKEHIGVKHNQMKRERSFICSECDFSTYTRTLLDAHTINRHTPYRRQVYKCDKCEAQLCSAHSLKEHVNLCHTNERPFPCSMCDFAAKSAKRLKNHMIYHSEKVFKCDTCGKMFYTRPQLRRHQLVHSRTTDFSCPYCSYQCSLAENLRKHCQAIHKVTYPAKKRLNYRREFPKPKQPKETTAHLEETVIRCISLPPVLEMINCSS